MRHAFDRRAALAALVAAAAATTPFAAAAQAGPVRLRIGFQKGGLLLLVKLRGTLDQALPGAQIEWKEFPAGPQLLEALDAGAIDFGVTGAPPPVFAQSAGRDFVIVGAEPGQPHSEAILVPADSPVKTVRDLRGRRVALARGSSSHFLLLGALAQQGLRISDVQPVFLGPADARAAFETGAVDAWVVWDPYLSIAEAARPLRVLANFATLLPAVSTPWSFYEARREFVQANPALVRQLVAALAREGAWAADHAVEVAKLLAPVLGIGLETVLRMQRRVRYGAVPASAAIAADQQKVADAFAAQGLIPKAVSVKDVFWLPR
ncbi:aliphatic sulfonate ABC transporter substrate-binding protein [Ideonella margarita]|uniref:Aliphatic sulfonate ABC transporter substrate-binding protein n=1 Tax=Ideonella margarita TaxID=2984191 RepID=A0ABU9C6C4_9BURK